MLPVDALLLARLRAEYPQTGKGGCEVADEREAFLTAIRADPNGFTSYLVFADWLDEHSAPVEARFYRAVGRHLEAHRRLPGRFAHWLPPGQVFPDAVYADDDRFAVSRHFGTEGTSLVVVDMNDISRGRGLERRHRGLQFAPVVALVQESDRLPESAEWDRITGDICDGAEFVGTFGHRLKAFSSGEALLRAMAEAFGTGDTAPG